MPPHEQTPATNAGFSPSAEILSDEEIRSRAAAYAQRVFEQQMEAYEAQRAQAIALLRAQEEYARRQAAYEEACRAYYAQQHAQDVAVRIDAETGEEISAAPSEDLPDENSEPDVFSSDAEAAPENAEESNFVSDEDESVPAEDDLPDALAKFSEEPFPQAKKYFEDEQEASTPPAAAFPWFVACVSVFCASVLAVVGYILFSGDPRFELQRNHFLSVLGVAEAPARSDEIKVPKKIEIPDFRSTPSSVSEKTVPEVSERVPASRTKPKSPEVADSAEVPERTAEEKNIASGDENSESAEEEEFWGEEDEAWSDD